MSFQTEPSFQHGQPARTAVLLCNLGTPDEPTAPALRRYLAEFLGDHRVVEIPRPIWWLILHGIILRTRPAKSASEIRQSIWLPEGSPLKVWTEKQATLLRGYLGERGHHVTVRYAMRYGNPSMASELDKLKAEGAHPHPDPARLSPVQRHHHRQRVRRRLHLGREGAPHSRAALRQPLPRRPGLHRGTGPADHEILAGPWPPGQAGDELSRRARAHPAPGRPLPLRMPQDRAPAGAKGWACRKTSTS